MRSTRLGFTLVELSIVLVILGLLVGGVLAGQSLIRASELRAIVTERDKFTTAINAFRDKYFALPGDKADAFRFWGASCGTDTTDASTGCNGDGDGRVHVNGGEAIKAWEHLARAVLIEGNFDGTGTVTGAGDRVRISVTNVPKSKFSQGAWTLHDCATGHAAGSSVNGLCMEFGTVSTTGNGSSSLVTLPSLTRGEAYNLDKKIDDAQASSGKMRGNNDSAMVMDEAHWFSFISSAHAAAEPSNSCLDTGTDYYRISADGEDFKGDCTITFIQ